MPVCACARSRCGAPTATHSAPQPPSLYAVPSTTATAKVNQGECNTTINTQFLTCAQSNLCSKKKSGHTER
eukprot:3419326-Prymnesium_polylepis.1